MHRYHAAAQLSQKIGNDVKATHYSSQEKRIDQGIFGDGDLVSEDKEMASQ